MASSDQTEAIRPGDQTEAIPQPPAFDESGPRPSGPGQPRGNGSGQPRPAPYVQEQPPMSPRERAFAELQEWLLNTLNGSIEDILRKAAEYGSGDLEMMGDRMARTHHLPSREAGMQASTAFYLDGKVARIMSAIEDGRAPSVDSWFDSFVYGLIGLKIAQTGKWL